MTIADMVRHGVIYTRSREEYSDYYHHYRDFWQNNLQSVGEISSDLEKSLLKLEGKYADFDSLYNEIINQIDVLSSIYSSCNSLLGREYLLKLKSMLYAYRQRYSLDGINFNALHFIHAKIKELQEKSFIDFPEMQHNETGAPQPHIEKPAEHADFISNFRWLTFERNNSWFLLPYDSVTVVDRRHATLHGSAQSHNASITFMNDKFPVIDLLAAATHTRYVEPLYYIIARYKTRSYCYAATHVGKRILSKKDFISAQMRPLGKTASTFRGAIRLFGRNHLCVTPGGETFQ